MRISLKVTVLVLFVVGPVAVQAQESEIESLRAAVLELRSDYEARIAELERRLAVAEQNAQQAGAGQSTPRTSTSGDSAFNPAIGVIFQGQAWNFNKDPDDYVVQGYPYGGEAGPVSEGLAIGETELIFDANVDDKFFASLTAALALEDGEARAFLLGHRLPQCQTFTHLGFRGPAAALPGISCGSICGQRHSDSLARAK
jgi:hypothetical protein